MGEDFEPWLERELRQAVGSVRAPSPRADQAAYRRGAARRRGPLAVVGAKGAVIMAAAALAVGVGATGVTAMTGSANPLSWGQRVVQAVNSCRDQAARDAQPGADAGVPDMGRCVSAFAGQRDGQAGRSPASGAPSPSSDRHTPDPSPSPVETGALKQSLDKNGDQGQEAGAPSDPGPQSGAQGDQGSRSDPTAQPGVRSPRPTDPARRPSPRPRPTPGHE